MTSLPLATAADNPVPKSVPCPPEDDPDGATSCPAAGSDSNIKAASTGTTSSIVTTAATTTRLAVLADLLAGLPATERRAVIASLPTTDRAAIAKLLVSQQASPLS